MRLPLVLGHLWASPVTLFGFAQSLFGARFHSVSSEGIFAFVVRPRTPLAWWMHRFHIAAYTTGAVVTYADELGPKRGSLVRHERAHVIQTMVLGPLMPLAYFGASLVVWLAGKRIYRDNPFEVAARRAEGA